MRKIYLLLWLLCVLTPLRAQSFVRTDSGIKTSMQSLNLEIQFFTPQIVRVYRTPDNTNPVKESLSVTKKPESVNLNITQDDNVVVLASDKIKVCVHLITGKVSFFDSANTPLFTEKDFGAQFTPVYDVRKATFSVRQAYMLDKDEAIYGLGQHQDGKMNQRNQKIYLRQSNMNVCIPLIVSTKGYGVFWDNYSPTTYADNPQ